MHYNNIQSTIHPLNNIQQNSIINNYSSDNSRRPTFKEPSPMTEHKIHS